MDPTGIPDLPRYIVALWRIERHMDFKTGEELKEDERQHGAIFKTEYLNDLRELYFLLTSSEVKELKLYQITPERIVFLIEYMG